MAEQDLTQEKQKWDAYYSSFSPSTISPAQERFNEVFAAAVRALLPEGGSTLEAGSGSGSQSLELARSRLFDVTLLDLSQDALSHARHHFEQAGLGGTFQQGNALSGGEPAFDLVFNNGTLEHYDVEMQRNFLRSMASRSKGYVISLVPNRNCYWYWIWRMAETSAKNWPYGREVPVIGQAEIFESVGLHNVRCAYLGSDWTEDMIATLPGLSSDLRDLILQIHRSPLVPVSSKSYLVATVGTVHPDITVSTGKPWDCQVGEDYDRALLTASLSDALAAKVGGDQRHKSLREQLADMAMQNRALEQRRADGEQRVSVFANQLKNVSARMSERYLESLQYKAELESVAEELQSALRAHQELAIAQRAFIGEIAGLDPRFAETLQACGDVKEEELLARAGALIQQEIQSLRAQRDDLKREKLRFGHQHADYHQLSHAYHVNSPSLRMTAAARYAGHRIKRLPVLRKAVAARRIYRERGLSAVFHKASEKFKSLYMMNWYQYLFHTFRQSRDRNFPIDWTRIGVPCRNGLVTIVLPAYNGEDMIAEAIDSVLAQTYTSFELIAINDGSKDRTGEILDAYAQKDSRIRVLHQENRKLPRTLSRGFSLAKGEFLTWTSVDNRLKPDFLEKMVACLQRHPRWDMVYANMDIIGEQGEPLQGSGWYGAYQNPPGTEHVHLPADTAELNIWPNNYVGAAFMYRARVARALGDYSPVRFLTEDYDYWMRVNEVMTLRHVDFDDCIYEYRFHNNSLTSKDKELGITRNRNKLMVFDDFRRSFYLTSCIWVIENDDGPRARHFADRLRRKVAVAGHVLLDAEQLQHYRLPRLWSPLMYIRFSESVGGRPSLPAEIRALAVSFDCAADGTVQSPAGWDLYITDREEDVLNPDESAERIRIPEIDDLFTYCDLQAKNIQLEAIETAIHQYSVGEVASTKKLSVVVCTYKRSKSLRALMESLLQQTAPIADYEIVIVNNSPAENYPRDLVEELRFRNAGMPMPSVRVIDCPLPGLSHARNAGISEAVGEYITFLDDDAIAQPDCLAWIIQAAAQHNGVGIIGGHIRLKVPDPVPQAYRAGRDDLWSQYLTNYGEYTEIRSWWEYPWGANWSARRQTLYEIGGFRCNFGRIGADFGGGEEIVAACLAVQLGYSVGIEPRAEVLHDVEVSRYTEEHIRKTIHAGVLTNYQMQKSLYLPFETSASQLALDFARVGWRVLRTKSRSSVGHSADLGDSLRLSAHLHARLALLKLVLADYWRRLKQPITSQN